MIKEIKKEISRLEVDRKTLRNFGLLFFGVFGIWAGIMYWKTNPYWPWPVMASIGFCLIGVFFPMSLRRPYRLWMSLAFVMGWFMTRLILSTLFFVVMTPMAVILRFLKKDLLGETIHKDARSYWNKYEDMQDKDRYGKQY